MSDAAFDYTQVQHTACPGCGHDASAIPPADLAAALVDIGRRWREFLDAGNQGGKRITSICHTRPSGAFFGLAQLSPFTRKSPAWRELMALPTIADRVAHMKNENVRKTLIAAGHLAPLEHQRPQQLRKRQR